MVEIIKCGRPPATVLLRVTCSECSTEFRFSVAEANRYEPATAEGGAAWHIGCPVCRHELKATPNDIERPKLAMMAIPLRFRPD